MTEPAAKIEITRMKFPLLTHAILVWLSMITYAFIIHSSTERGHFTIKTSLGITNADKIQFVFGSLWYSNGGKEGWVNGDYVIEKGQP